MTMTMVPTLSTANVHCEQLSLEQLSLFDDINNFTNSYTALQASTLWCSAPLLQWLVSAVGVAMQILLYAPGATKVL
jgi:hypothetical protein